MLVLSVKLELPVPVIELGLNVAVTPEGNPDADKLTGELNPQKVVFEIIDQGLLPRVTPRRLGVALIMKLPAVAAVTVSVSLVDCTMLPLVP